LKRFLIKVLLAVLYWFTAWFLAIQVAFWISNFQSAGADLTPMLKANSYNLFGWSVPKLCFDPNIMYWQGNNNYHRIAQAIIYVGMAIMILNWLIPSKAQRQKNEAKQGLTAQQKEQFTHRASIHEAKKGLQRLQWNVLGFLDHDYYTPEHHKVPMLLGHTLIILFLMNSFEFVMIGIERFGNLLHPGWTFRLAAMRNSKTALLISLIIIVACFLILSMPICDKEAYEHQFLWYFRKDQTPEQAKMQEKFYNRWLSMLPDIPVLKHFKASPKLIYWLLHFKPHIRDYMDFLFNPHKKMINGIRFRLKLPANNNLNTLHYESIDGFRTCRIAGASELTYCGKSYVEAGKLHDLGLASTNSGKTYSFIHPMIELCAMAGHCMFINDIKNELYQAHAYTLERLGYRVIKVNFIDPEDGECWNPFGGFIRRFREQQQIFRDSMSEETRHEHDVLKSNWYKHENEVLRYSEAVQAAFPNASDNYKKVLLGKLEMKKHLASDAKDAYEDWLLKNTEKYTAQDYSDAYEQLHDICTVLCEEKDTKQPFFWQQAATLLEGIIAFLAEYETLDENGNFHTLDDDQINFKNADLLKREGLKKESTPDGSKYLLGYWISHFRLRTDKSVEDLDDIVNPKGDNAGSSINDVSKTFDNHIRLGTMNERIAKMLSRTTFDFSSVGTQKTAIFMVVHDERSTYYPFVTMFFTQFYHELIKESREGNNNGKLPIPFDIIWDEFGISPAIPDIDNVIAACRSRSVRLHLIVQDYAQLEATYHRDTAKSIQANVATTFFLSSNSEDTLGTIAKKCGTTLTWNRQTKRYDVTDTIPANELKTLSLAQGIVIRNRRMPLKTTFFPYERYSYFANINGHGETKKNNLMPYKVFSLAKAVQESVSMAEEEIQKHKYRQDEAARQEEDNEKEKVQRKNNLGAKRPRTIDALPGNTFAVDEKGITQKPFIDFGGSKKYKKDQLPVNDKNEKGKDTKEISNDNGHTKVHHRERAS